MNIEKIRELLEALDALDIDDEDFQDLNAELEDAIFMLEETDPEDEQEAAQAVEEILSGYGRWEEAAGVVRRFEE